MLWSFHPTQLPSTELPKARSKRFPPRAQQMGSVVAKSGSKGSQRGQTHCQLKIPGTCPETRAFWTSLSTSIPPHPGPSHLLLGVRLSLLLTLTQNSWGSDGSVMQAAPEQTEVGGASWPRASVPAREERGRSVRAGEGGREHRLRDWVDVPQRDLSVGFRGCLSL